VVVFHANWILAAVASKFLLPLSNFVLDTRFNVLQDREAFLMDNPGSQLSVNLALKSSAKRKKFDMPVEKTSSTEAHRRKRPRPTGHDIMKIEQRNSEKASEDCSDDQVLMQIQDDGNASPQVNFDTPRLRPGALDTPLSTVAVITKPATSSTTISASSERTSDRNDDSTKFATMATTAILLSTTKTSFMDSRLPVDVWKSLLSGERVPDGLPTILVTDALSCLSCISIEDVATFVPGADHLGQKFVHVPNVRRKTV